MISILLLVVLTASVCAGSSFLNVRQTSYEAEENRNIMMEWIFTPNLTLTSLNIYCAFWLSDEISKTVYHFVKGVEQPESQDQQFAGRVHFDQNDFTKGNIRLHLSRLRTEDSGIYQCEVFTLYEGGVNECSLSVTAARIQPTAEETQPASRGRITRPLSWGTIGLLIGLGLQSLQSFPP
ncbi:CD276 antigen homolog isoform X2 [Myripristis murdjan]|nr:CD276 antigen homolog isoform X2 [Myripristis murdjan]